MKILCWLGWHRWKKEITGMRYTSFACKHCPQTLICDRQDMTQQCLNIFDSEERQEEREWRKRRWR